MRDRLAIRRAPLDECRFACGATIVIRRCDGDMPQRQYSVKDLFIGLHRASASSPRLETTAKGFSLLFQPYEALVQKSGLPARVLELSIQSPPPRKARDETTQEEPQSIHREVIIALR